MSIRETLEKIFNGPTKKEQEAYRDEKSKKIEEIKNELTAKYGEIYEWTEEEKLKKIIAALEQSLLGINTLEPYDTNLDEPYVLSRLLSIQFQKDNEEKMGGISLDEISKMEPFSTDKMLSYFYIELIFAANYSLNEKRDPFRNIKKHILNHLNSAISLLKQLQEKHKNSGVEAEDEIDEEVEKALKKAKTVYDRLANIIGEKKFDLDYQIKDIPQINLGTSFE